MRSQWIVCLLQVDISVPDSHRRKFCGSEINEARWWTVYSLHWTVDYQFFLIVYIEHRQYFSHSPPQVIRFDLSSEVTRDVASHTSDILNTAD